MVKWTPLDSLLIATFKRTKDRQSFDLNYGLELSCHFNRNELISYSRAPVAQLDRATAF